MSEVVPKDEHGPLARIILDDFVTERLEEDLLLAGHVLTHAFFRLCIILSSHLNQLFHFIFSVELIVLEDRLVILLVTARGDPQLFLLLRRWCLGNGFFACLMLLRRRLCEDLRHGPALAPLGQLFLQYGHFVPVRLVAM